MYQWAVLLVPMIGFSWMSLQKYLADARKKKDALDVAEVVKSSLDVAAQSTDKKLAAVLATTKSTNAMVDGAKAINLQAIASMSEELARLKQTPESAEAAKIARAAYDDHVKHLAAIDVPSMPVDSESIQGVAETYLEELRQKKEAAVEKP